MIVLESYSWPDSPHLRRDRTGPWLRLQEAHRHHHIDTREIRSWSLSYGQQSGPGRTRDVLVLGFERSVIEIKGDVNTAHPEIVDDLDADLFRVLVAGDGPTHGPDERSLA